MPVDVEFKPKQLFKCFVFLGFASHVTSAWEYVENYCIPRSRRLLAQTTKEPLSNFEPQKP